MSRSISKLFFENTWVLLGLLVTIQFVWVAWWSWRRTPWAARLVWIGFSGMALLLPLNKIIVTPREQVIQLCRALAVLVDQGDIEGIGQHLAADFRFDQQDRAQFLDRLRRRLTDYHIDQPHLHSFDVIVREAGEATAKFGATCRIQSADALFGLVPSRWELSMRRSGHRWLVTRISGSRAAIGRR